MNEAAVENEVNRPLCSECNLFTHIAPTFHSGLGINRYKNYARRVIRPLWIYDASHVSICIIRVSTGVCAFCRQVCLYENLYFPMKGASFIANTMFINEAPGVPQHNRLFRCEQGANDKEDAAANEVLMTAHTHTQRDIRSNACDISDIQQSHYDNTHTVTLLHCSKDPD